MGLTDRIFPENDYKKDGSLKIVRGRVLKKLLKYEFKAILTVLLPMVGVLLLAAIFLGLNMGEDFFGLIAENDQPISESKSIFGMLFLMLYLYLNAAVLIISITISSKRYQKNFFGNEGYLTLSIPASAEEHLFAKHLSGIVGFFIGVAGCVLGCLIVALFGGFEFLQLVGELFAELGALVSELDPLYWLSIVEAVLNSLISTVGIFCLIGASICFLEKFSKKARGIITFIVVVVAFTLIEAVFALLVDSGVYETLLTNYTVEHILSWVWILLSAAATFGLFMYERKMLKKINLK